MFIGGHVGLSVGMLVGWRRFTGASAHFRLIPLAVFALLPDLLDKPLGLIYMDLGTRRLAAHSLLFSAHIVLSVRRFLPRFALYAWFTPLHLFLDSMWNYPHTLLFPFLGLRFDPDLIFPSFASWLDMVFWRVLHSPETLVPEIAGTLVLALHFWRRAERGHPPAGHAPPEAPPG